MRKIIVGQVLTTALAIVFTDFRILLFFSILSSTLYCLRGYGIILTLMKCIKPELIVTVLTVIFILIFRRSLLVSLIVWIIIRGVGLYLLYEDDKSGVYIEVEIDELDNEDDWK